MPAQFYLNIETDQTARRAALLLTDEHGRQLGLHEVGLDEHPPSAWEGVFDMRAHVMRMQSDARPASVLLAEIGAFVAGGVLGSEIMTALARDGIQERALVVRVPDSPNDKLAAALARVPWEIAKRAGDRHTLLESNVIVRATAGGVAGRGRTIEPGEREPLRVLLVFAEAPGSRPLAMRLERERLMDLFFDEVLPSKLVEVDVLCHGVTRRRLTEQIQERGGYHVIHWSGHGHHDHLEVHIDPGEAFEERFMAGTQLIDLLRRAGGVVPDLFFLSACHSGALVSARDWETLRAAARDPWGDTRGSVATPALDKSFDASQGYTGTALQLLHAGVSQVVAMRYEVSDAYARRLARRFYRHLLAGRADRSVEAALALARAELTEHPRAAEHHAVDHATPLVLGNGSMRLAPARKRSPQADRRDPRPQPLLTRNRDLERPRHFVGRAHEMRCLVNEWLDRRGESIAMIQGLAGLGKTALAAEAIHLWHPRFDHVLAFTGRGGNLSVEEFLRQLDEKLRLRSKVYRERCTEDEMAAVHIAASKVFTGDVRWQHLRENLVSTLRAERFLLVLDNLETILRPSPRADGTYDAQDPEWDHALATLADGLRSSGSRVLVTSRHRPAALAGDRGVTLALGPLPMGEAVLFFQDHATLGELFFSNDTSERKLAERVLSVSRGHPLILQRLAAVADDGTTALANALDRIQGDGFRTLPDIFAGAAGAAQREQERKYLEDVAVSSVDLLIERLSCESRQLLWVVTRSFDGVDEQILEGVWGRYSPDDEECAHLAEILEHVGRMPATHRERLPSMPEDVRVAFEEWKARGEPGARTRPSMPLADLLDAGLVHRDGEDGGITFHELVAERAAEHAKTHPSELGSRTESEVWTAYGVRYRALFWKLLEKRTPGSRDEAVEMGKRGIRYLVRAAAFEELSGFAGYVATSTQDPALLGEVITELRAVIDAAPAGKARWQLRTNLADALSRAERPDRALDLYAQAAEEAEAAGQESQLAVIYQHWANALGDIGDLAAAKAAYQRSAQAGRKAGVAHLEIAMSELGALRLDLRSGLVAESLPAIEVAVAQVRDWWARRQAGAEVPEVPNDEHLARALVVSLNIAAHAYVALDRWEECLRVLDESEQLKRSLGAGEHEIAITRHDRYPSLVALGRLAEAKLEMEKCLDAFRHAGDVTGEAKALSALADVWNRFDDPRLAINLERQALAVRERMPDPEDRAVSHNHLAGYLRRAGQPDEANEHQLAELSYRLVTEIGLDLPFQNLARCIRDAGARGETFALPRLADVLVKPAYGPLREWLSSHATDAEELQATIDRFFELARTEALLSLLPSEDGIPPHDAGCV